MEKKALLLSSVLAFFAMYLVWNYISTEDDKLKREYADFFSVVVASRDILQFQTVRPTDLEVVKVPRAMVPPGRVSNATHVVDAVAAVPILKGEFILDNKLISKNVYSGLDTQVALGRRAISIPVNMKSSIGFMVQPGNRVDVAAHFEYKAKGVSISEVKVFLQDVLVLAAGSTIQTTTPESVDQSLVSRMVKELGPERKKVYREAIDFAGRDQNFTTVTLEVSPEQAQRIAYVNTVYGGSLILLLRNPNDRQLARTATTNLYDIMGNDSYLVKSQKVPLPKNLPRTQYFDFVGDRTVPVQ